MNALRNPPNKQVMANAAISLLLSFTFFVFAPVSLYATNSSEFWFGIGDMIPIMAIGFVITFVMVFVLLCFVKGTFHDITLAIIFAIGFALYVQGNWLPADYEVLDGRAIAWENYQGKAIINLVFWILLIVIPIVFAIIKRSEAKTVFKWTASFILAIQLVTMITLSFSIPKKSESYFMSTEKMFELSSEKNTIIFVLDTFDADYFRDIVKTAPEFLEPLDGFTFFNDMTGAYPTTKGALPFILTGQWNENDMPYKEYVEQAYANTTLYSDLLKYHYDNRLFVTSQFVSSNQDIYIMNNVKTKLVIRDQRDFFSMMYKFVSFRYMPRFLKPAFWFYSGDFDMLKLSANKDVQVFSNDNVTFYKQLVDQGLSKQSGQNGFRVYHLVGAHPPYNMNEKTEKISTDQATLQGQVKGSLNIVYEYIAQMKRQQLYDDATIIVMADHGATNPLNADPLMMVKPANASGKLAISQAPVSMVDLHATIMRDIATDYSKYGSSMFDFKPNESRKRRFLYYKWDNSWDASFLPMLYEYEVTGKSNDIDSYLATGRASAKEGFDKFQPTSIKLDETVTMQPNGEKNAANYFLAGLSYIEQESFAWTTGKKALFAMTLEEKPTTDLLLKLNLMPYNLTQKIIVKAGTEILLEKQIVAYANSIDIPIPMESIINSELSLELEFPDSTSRSDDPRELAFAIAGITVTQLPTLEFGEKLLASNAEAFYSMFSSGISYLENTYAWTDGATAGLQIHLQDEPKADMNLVFKLMPYNTQQRIIVKSGEDIIYEQEIPAAAHEIKIPISQETAQGRTIKLTLEFPDSTSRSDDPRELAFAISQLVVSEIGA